MTNLHQEYLNLQEEYAAFKASAVKRIADLERENLALKTQRAIEDAYTPDPSWPGTATKNDAPKTRICYRCLLIVLHAHSTAPARLAHLQIARRVALHHIRICFVAL